MTQANAPDNIAPVTNARVASSVGTSMLARLSGLIDVIAQPIYVALFGLASFGLYAVLWSAVNLAENIADLGQTSAMQRTVPQAASEAEAAEAFRAAMLLGVVPPLLLAILGAIFAPQVAAFFNADAIDSERLIFAIHLFIWALPLWAFVEVATSAMRARHVFGAEIRLRLFWEQSLRLVFAVVFWAMGWGILGLLAAHLLSLSVTALLAARMALRYFHGRALFGRVRPALLKESLMAGLAVLPANMSQRFYSDGAPIALNWLIPGGGGAVAAGLFTIARKISSIIQTIRLGFAYVLAPLASAARRGRGDEVREVYGFATRVLTALALPSGLVLAAAAPAILALFGKGAATAATAVAILITSRILEALAGAAQPIQQVISSYRAQVLASFAGIAVAIATGWLLLPAGGLTGMAVAVTAGLVTGAMLPVLQLWAEDGLHPFAAPFARMFGISLIIGVIFAGATRLTMGWPVAIALPLSLVLLLLATWLACRFALPLGDRAALGKTGRALKLV